MSLPQHSSTQNIPPCPLCSNDYHSILSYGQREELLEAESVEDNVKALQEIQLSIQQAMGYSYSSALSLTFLTLPVSAIFDKSFMNHSKTQPTKRKSLYSRPSKKIPQSNDLDSSLMPNITTNSCGNVINNSPSEFNQHDGSDDDCKKFDRDSDRNGHTSKRHKPNTNSFETQLTTKSLNRSAKQEIHYCGTCTDSWHHVNTFVPIDQSIFSTLQFRHIEQMYSSTPPKKSNHTDKTTLYTTEKPITTTPGQSSCAWFYHQSAALTYLSTVNTLTADVSNILLPVLLEFNPHSLNHFNTRESLQFDPSSLPCIAPYNMSIPDLLKLDSHDIMISSSILPIMHNLVNYDISTLIIRDIQSAITQSAQKQLEGCMGRYKLLSEGTSVQTFNDINLYHSFFSFVTTNAAFSRIYSIIVKYILSNVLPHIHSIITTPSSTTQLVAPSEPLESLEKLTIYYFSQNINHIVIQSVFIVLTSLYTSFVSYYHTNQPQMILSTPITSTKSLEDAYFLRLLTHYKSTWLQSKLLPFHDKKNLPQFFSTSFLSFSFSATSTFPTASIFRQNIANIPIFYTPAECIEFIQQYYNTHHRLKVVSETTENPKSNSLQNNMSDIQNNVIDLAKLLYIPSLFHIYTQELTETGTRAYAVMDIQTFLTRYHHLQPDDKKYCEIIPEHKPCVLYLDLEYALHDYQSIRSHSQEHLEYKTPKETLQSSDTSDLNYSKGEPSLLSPHMVCTYLQYKENMVILLHFLPLFCRSLEVGPQDNCQTDVPFDCIHSIQTFVTNSIQADHDVSMTQIFTLLNEASYSSLVNHTGFQIMLQYSEISPQLQVFQQAILSSPVSSNRMISMFHTSLSTLQNFHNAILLIIATLSHLSLNTQGNNFSISQHDAKMIELLSLHVHITLPQPQNLHVNGITAIRTLLHAIFLQMHRHFPTLTFTQRSTSLQNSHDNNAPTFSPSFNSNNVFDLQCVRNTKFSRHLTIHLNTTPQELTRSNSQLVDSTDDAPIFLPAAFKNAAHLKVFMDSLYYDIKQAIATNQGLSPRDISHLCKKHRLDSVDAPDAPLISVKQLLSLFLDTTSIYTWAYYLRDLDTLQSDPHLIDDSHTPSYFHQITTHHPLTLVTFMTLQIPSSYPSSSNSSRFNMTPPHHNHLTKLLHNIQPFHIQRLLSHYTFLCDLGVYSPNRCFRLMLSSKRKESGKFALRPSLSSSRDYSVYDSLLATAFQSYHSIHINQLYSDVISARNGKIQTHTNYNLIDFLTFRQYILSTLLYYILPLPAPPPSTKSLNSSPSARMTAKQLLPTLITLSGSFCPILLEYPHSAAEIAPSDVIFSTQIQPFMVPLLPYHIRAKVALSSLIDFDKTTLFHPADSRYIPTHHFTTKLATSKHISTISHTHQFNLQQKALWSSLIDLNVYHLLNIPIHHNNRGKNVPISFSPLQFLTTVKNPASTSAIHGLLHQLCVIKQCLPENGEAKDESAHILPFSTIYNTIMPQFSDIYIFQSLKVDVIPKPSVSLLISKSLCQHFDDIQLTNNTSQRSYVLPSLQPQLQTVLSQVIDQFITSKQDITHNTFSEPCQPTNELIQPHSFIIFQGQLPSILPLFDVLMKLHCLWEICYSMQQQISSGSFPSTLSVTQRDELISMYTRNVILYSWCLELSLCACYQCLQQYYMAQRLYNRENGTNVQFTPPSHWKLYLLYTINGGMCFTANKPHKSNSVVRRVQLNPNIILSKKNTLIAPVTNAIPVDVSKLVDPPVVRKTTNLYTRRQKSEPHTVTKSPMPVNLNLHAFIKPSPHRHMFSTTCRCFDPECGKKTRQKYILQKHPMINQPITNEDVIFNLFNFKYTEY